MHKLFCYIIIAFLCANIAWADDGKIARIEGQYTAHYNYENDVESGDFTETGMVVYYLAQDSDKKSVTKYDIYPERIVNNSNDSTLTKISPKLEIFKAFWPVPSAMGKAQPVDTVSANGITTLTFNLKDNFDADSRKAMRVAGLNMDIDTAVVTLTLKAPHINKASLSSFQTLSEKLIATFNGRQYRRMFGGKPAKCNVDINITFNSSDSTTILTKKEAKAMRKGERKIWESAHE